MGAGRAGFDTGVDTDAGFERAAVVANDLGLKNPEPNVVLA